MARTASDNQEQAATPTRAHAGPPLASRAVRAWALLPLRLFLGLTFIDAGAGKLLSPAYFGAGPQSFAALARGFAEGSPLAGPVRAVVLPRPFLFALLLAVLELVVGVCAVLGLVSRLAAGVGLGLSVTFFLTASWQIRPFFYGADLPFAAGWLTLLLAGHGGLPSVDAVLLRRRRTGSASGWTGCSSSAPRPTSEAAARRRPRARAPVTAAPWPASVRPRQPRTPPVARSWTPPETPPA